jgi:hypothetical protein
MQNITTAQRATLKAYFVAIPAMNAMYLIGNLGGLADALNVAAAPSFTVWKTNVSINEVGDNLVGTELAGLTTGNQTRLQTIALYSALGLNPSLADRRAFFDDVFSRRNCY